MNLHTDIPVPAQVERLLAHREPSCVTIYVPTDPTSPGDRERIEFRNLAGEAVRQLRDAGSPRTDVQAIEDAVTSLVEDAEFWRYQARSLAAFLSPTLLVTFRLPNRLLARVEVADRFFVKPLLRTVTFPQVAFVLALAQGSVRVVEVTADAGPWEVKVDDLPRDVASAARQSTIKDRSPSGRLQGTEGEKIRMLQYARQVDQALRPLLDGLGVPLILAAAEPMNAIYRSVNSYPDLAPTGIPGNPEATSDSELALRARAVLDQLYAAEVRRLHEVHDARAADGRALGDVAEVARAATMGAVDTVLVDIDAVLPGVLDEHTGAVTFAQEEGIESYGLLDEISRRVLRNGGRVLAVRRQDIPGQRDVAAILRFPL
ncbi:MAG: hypothetical protein J2P44_10565 [Candidatus Dormibacteraeota bacterium]|nr:hypothetical protein [Candidatus Dormibacteraeota bacterium]